MGEIPRPVLERAAKALNQSMAGDPTGWEWMTGEAEAVLRGAGYAEMVEALKAAEKYITELWGGFEGFGSEGRQITVQIRSALAKATTQEE